MLHTAVRTLGLWLILLTLTARSGSAQCLDWADGYAADQLGADGIVRAMLTREENGQTVVYVAGDFQRIGGIDATGIARFDGSQWTQLGDGIDSGVRDLVEFDDGTGLAIYAAGTFEFNNGQEHSGVARWKNGHWSSAGADVNGQNRVFALAVHEGELFAAGNFESVNGEFTDRIVAWNGTTWRTFFGGPPERTGHALAFDEAAGHTVLFAGEEPNSGTVYPETWSYDGTEWELLAIDGPERRQGHSMAYDSLRQRVLMFGGVPRGWGTPDSRLWSWDGNAWSIAADFMPIAYDEVSIAYDSSRDRVVWFGGRVGNNDYFDQTWEFDGAQWYEAVPATTRPPARTRYAIGYDESRQRVVMFGGNGYTLGDLNDTWEWDGTDWTLVAAGGPAPRWDGEFVYDALRQRMVLHGGRTTSEMFTDTWAWDGASWTQLAPNDPNRPNNSDGPIAYDSARDRIVLRDNRGATWTWNNTAWQAVNKGGLNHNVNTLASFDAGSGAELYVGGEFTRAGPFEAGRVARLTDTGWQTVGAGIQGSYCHKLYVWDDGAGPDLYIAGSYTRANNRTMQSIGRWDGSAWSLLNVGSPGDGGGVIGSVRSVFAYDDGSGEKLYVGGDFDHADGPGFDNSDDIEVSNIARWDGSVWETVGIGIEEPGGSNRGVYALGAVSINGQSRLMAGGSFDLSGGKPSANLAEWGTPCSLPTFIEHPEDVIAMELEPVIFSVRVAGTRPLTYQWRKDGVAISDDGRITGTNTDLLYIDPWIESDSGAYDVVATNPLGSATSNPAGLTTFPGGNSGGIVAVVPAMMKGDPVPWDENATMVTVGPGTVGTGGDGVFWADGHNEGIDAIFRWRDSAATPVVKVDDPAPGLPSGVFFGNYQRNLRHSGFVSDDGGVFFTAHLYGDGINNDNDERLWYNNSETFEHLGGEGQHAPGFPPEVTLGRGFYAHGSPGNWVSYIGTLNGGGYDNNIDKAVWQWGASTGHRVLAQHGATAPGTNRVITDIAWPVVQNSGGDALLWIGLDNVASTLLLRKPAEDLYIVTTGDQAPGFDPGQVVDAVWGGPNARLAASERVVFRARVTGPDEFRSNTLYSWENGVFRTLMKQGDIAPGVPGNLPLVFGTIHAINDQGDTVFSADIDPINCNETCIRNGLFIDENGTLTNIAYDEMSPVPGLSDVFEYSGTGLSAINNSRQLIFQAAVRLNNAPYVAVFGWDPDNGMFPIAVPGTQLEVAPGDIRVVSGANLSYVNIGLSGNHLTEAAISDEGRFLFTASFTDGTHGVFEGSFADFFRNYFPCHADFNDDENVNTLDVLAFLNAWVAEDEAADINGDGDVNTLDVLAFLNLWTAGC